MVIFLKQIPLIGLLSFAALSSPVLAAEETEPVACQADLQECQDTLSTCNPKSKSGRALRGKSPATCEEELNECRALLEYCLSMEHVIITQTADLCTLEPLENGRYRFRIESSNFGDETEISGPHGLLEATVMETRDFMQWQDLESWDDTMSFQFDTIDGVEPAQEFVVGSMTIVGETDTDFSSRFDVDNMSLPYSIEYRYDVEVIGGTFDLALFGDVKMVTFHACVFETSVAASSFGHGVSNKTIDDNHERLRNQALAALKKLEEDFGGEMMSVERATKMGMKPEWLQNVENVKDLQKKADLISKAAPKLANAIKQCKNNCADFDSMLSALSDLMITVGPLVSLAYPPAGAGLTVLGSMGLVFGALIGEQPSKPPTLQLADIQRALNEALHDWSSQRDETEILAKMGQVARFTRGYGKDLAVFLKQKETNDPDLDGDIAKWFRSFTNRIGNFHDTLLKVEEEYRNQLGESGRRHKFFEQYLNSNPQCANDCGLIDGRGAYNYLGYQGSHSELVRTCGNRLDNGEKAYESILAYARGYLENASKLFVWKSTVISILQESSFCDPDQYDYTTRQKDCKYFYDIRDLQTEAEAVEELAYKVDKVTRSKIPEVCLTHSTKDWPFAQECHEYPSDKKCNYPHLMTMATHRYKSDIEHKDEKNKIQYLSGHDWFPFSDHQERNMRNDCNAFFNHNSQGGFASDSMVRNNRSTMSTVWRSSGNQCSEVVKMAMAVHGALIAVPNYCINAGGCADLFHSDKEWM